MIVGYVTICRIVVCVCVRASAGTLKNMSGVQIVGFFRSQNK
jgi:hypothetical protein